jgi:hypothetical protein
MGGKTEMNVFEFILLILGVFSMIHYISYSLYRCKNYKYFVLGVLKENSNIYVIRVIEFVIILINIAVWIYKLLF